MKEAEEIEEAEEAKETLYRRVPDPQTQKPGVQSSTV